MFTYLVLPFGSAPFSREKIPILCTSYALRNGLFVLFRTVLYIDVHRGLGHGLGQNVTSKIWLNFLTAKCKKKLRNQAISELFMVDSTGLEPVFRVSGPVLSCSTIIFCAGNDVYCAV